MKGLILNCMGKHEDAQRECQAWPQERYQSRTCAGTSTDCCKRAEKKYDEAIKAYRNALRIDKVRNIALLLKIPLMTLLSSRLS